MPHLHHFWVLAIVGRPDAAVRKRDVVLAAVETQSSPFLLAMALTFEMILWHQLLSPERVATVAERLRRVTEEQDFALLHVFAHVGLGWAACQRGDLTAGTAQIERGLELQEATGAQLVRRYLCVYLVEAHLAAGRPAEGLAAVREILVRPEDRLGAYLDSELFRLEGELLRASGDAAAAEASFRKALGIARDQGARGFELRTATSLGRLLAEQGRGAEALPPLAAVYQTYTEGFETRDLQDARDLLDRLAPRPRATVRDCALRTSPRHSAPGPPSPGIALQPAPPRKLHALLRQRALLPDERPPLPEENPSLSEECPSLGAEQSLLLKQECPLPRKPHVLLRQGSLLPEE